MAIITLRIKIKNFQFRQIFGLCLTQNTTLYILANLWSQCSVESFRNFWQNHASYPQTLIFKSLSSSSAGEQSAWAAHGEHELSGTAEEEAASESHKVSDHRHQSILRLLASNARHQHVVQRPQILLPSNLDDDDHQSHLPIVVLRCQLCESNRVLCDFRDLQSGHFQAISAPKSHPSSRCWRRNWNAEDWDGHVSVCQHL